MRIFMVDIMRALAERNVGSWLPDLPGTGESLRPLSGIDWEDWRGAVRAAGDAVASRAGRRPHVIALRGGALLADAVEGRSCWCFAPASGASLIRHLQRTQLISDRNNRDDITDIQLEYAGYRLSSSLHGSLEKMGEPVLPDPHRTIPADSYASQMLWRRAEPDRDRELSSALAADIAGWIVSCEPR